MRNCREVLLKRETLAAIAATRAHRKGEMSGSAAFVILSLGTLLEVLVVVCAVRRKLFRRYFFLNLYMILCAVASLGRWQILKQEGIKSASYRYFYYYSDAVLTIILFFALISLYIF